MDMLMTPDWKKIKEMKDRNCCPPSKDAVTLCQKKSQQKDYLDKEKPTSFQLIGFCNSEDLIYIAPCKSAASFHFEKTLYSFSQRT